MRIWQPPNVSADEQGDVIHKNVVPKCYRGGILSFVHDDKFSGYLGINKTLDHIRPHLVWSKIRHDVVEYCRNCNFCQIAGKHN